MTKEIITAIADADYAVQRHPHAAPCRVWLDGDRVYVRSDRWDRGAPTPTAVQVYCTDQN